MRDDKQKILRLLLTVILFTFSISGFSKTIIEGDYTVGGSISKTFVAGTTTVVKGDLIIKNKGADVNVNASIIVYGDLILENDANLDVNAGAEVIVVGNFVANNDSDLLLRAGSNAVVRGDFISGNNIKISRPWSLSANSSFYVLGNINKNAIDIVRVDVFGIDELLEDDFELVEWLSIYNEEEPTLTFALINFDAKAFADYNQLIWSTSSEGNNEYFSIYKSYDKTNWEWLVDEKTKCEKCTTNTDYEFIDANAENKTTYYKLTKTDSDGATEELKIATIEVEEESADFVIYKDGITVTFSDPNETETVVITSTSGKILYKKSFSGIHDVFIETANIASKGVYIVSLYTSDKIKSQKFVK